MTGSALEYFANIRPQNVIRIKNARENGQKVVGIYCTYCPQELVIAASAIPVGLCGTSENPIPAAEEVLPRNLCPLIKSSFGFAATDTCPFFALSDMIVGETTCDGKKKMFEQLSQIKPVHVMQLPHQMHLESSMDLWTAEIQRLRRTLEKQLDTTITDQQIRDAIELVNKETEAVKAVCDLNRSAAPPLSGLEMLTITWSRFFNSDKNETIQMATRLRGEISAEGRTFSGPRVLLTGCPVGLGSEKVVRIVEESGGRVVVAENCSGYKTMELQADASLQDPIAALALKYSQIPCSCMTPNTNRMDLVSRLIDDFQADAVIDLSWQACHTYNIESYDIEKLVKGKQIPFLHLESDYSASDTESLKLRIEALLEMAGK